MVFAWMMTFDGADGSLEAAPSMMKGGHPSLVAVLPFPAPLFCPVNCLKGVSIVPSSSDYASKASHYGAIATTHDEGRLAGGASLRQAQLVLLRVRPNGFSDVAATQYRYQESRASTKGERRQKDGERSQSPSRLMWSPFC